MTIAGAFNDITTNLGGTPSTDGTIKGAIDKLNDTLAGSDQEAGNTIEESIEKLGLHIGSGGSELGPLVLVGVLMSQSSSIDIYDEDNDWGESPDVTGRQIFVSDDPITYKETSSTTKADLHQCPAAGGTTVDFTTRITRTQDIVSIAAEIIHPNDEEMTIEPFSDYEIVTELDKVHIKVNVPIVPSPEDFPHDSAYEIYIIYAKGEA